MSDCYICQGSGRVTMMLPGGAGIWGASCPSCVHARRWKALARRYRQRLRAHGALMSIRKYQTRVELEAEIERLRGENERLQRKVEKYKARWLHEVQNCEASKLAARVMDELESARARVAELEGAIRSVLPCLIKDGCGGCIERLKEPLDRTNEGFRPSGG